MSKLKPYDKYQSVIYDYVSQLPEDWKLLPNIAIFQERKETGFINEELLSVTIGRGVIKQSELDKKDSSTLDKSKYLLVYPGDLVYSMRFRQGASGYSNYKGIVSPACTVLKAKKGVEINPRYFYYVFRTKYYKNYVERFAYGIADGQIPLRYVDFKRMYSVVPPLETQNAIVEYLDQKTKQIQDFISKKERLINLLSDEINFLVNNDNDWAQEKAKWIFDERKIKNAIEEELLAVTQDRGVIPKKLCEENFVSPNSYEGLKLVEENDFVISLRSFQGGIEFSEYKGIVSPAYTIIRLKEAYNSHLYRCFFKYYFKSPKLISLLNTVISGIRDGQNINWSDFKNIILSLPNKHIIEKMLPKFRNLEYLKLQFEIEKKKINEYQESLITQLVTGQLRVPEQKVELTKANWEFKEAVLIAFLTKKCATGEYPLGRKRYTKFSYLFHRYTDNKIEKYRNKAAGPYNHETKYKGPEKIAKQNKYIQERKEGNFNGFIPDKNIEKALDYFIKYWTEEDIAWFEKNKYLSNDKLELIATVDKAILDLQKQNKAVSFENVKKYIQESEEWKAKLKREIFSDDNIRQTIKDLDTFFHK